MAFMRQKGGRVPDDLARPGIPQPVPPAPTSGPEVPPDWSGSPSQPFPGSQPEMPPPAGPPPASGQSGTPLGPGTFELPGQAGAAPFRTLDFLRNPNVSGAGGPPQGAGGVPVDSVGASAGEPPIDPEMLKRIFQGVLGGR